MPFIKWATSPWTMWTALSTASLCCAPRSPATRRLQARCRNAPEHGPPRLVEGQHCCCWRRALPCGPAHHCCSGLSSSGVVAAIGPCVGIRQFSRPVLLAEVGADDRHVSAVMQDTPPLLLPLVLVA